MSGRTAGAARVALVTGAASGIGAATARAVPAARLAHGRDRPAAIRHRPVRAVRRHRRERHALGAIDGIAGQTGRIDAAVSAAGYYEEGIDVCDISRAQWDSMLAVILGGTVNTCAAVLPHLIGEAERDDHRHLVRAGPGGQRH